jgi:hypothetical protein
MEQLRHRRADMTTSSAPIQLPPRVELLIEQAKDQAALDKRTEQRYPFFQPVTLRRGLQSLSAFSRDISESGMGLLHDMPIGGEYTVVVHDPDGCAYDITGVVMWCRPCGQGWYLSGVRFSRVQEMPGRRRD